MQIKTLWHKYEDCIELVVAVDEYLDEANPDYWEEKCDEVRRNRTPDEERVITFDIPLSVIDDAFKPTHIKGVLKV